jgi:hypothetical protein
VSSSRAFRDECGSTKYAGRMKRPNSGVNRTAL